MPSSLPWRYLHFTTSSNNHATSSLKKENTARWGSVSPPPPSSRGAEIKSFSYANSEISPCFIIPTIIKTGHQHPQPHRLMGRPRANYLPFCKRSGHMLASGTSGMVNCAVPELSPFILQNKLIFNLAQRTVSPLATAPQTKHSENQIWRSWLKNYHYKWLGGCVSEAFIQTSILRPNRFGN